MRQPLLIYLESKLGNLFMRNRLPVEPVVPVHPVMTEIGMDE